MDNGQTAVQFVSTWKQGCLEGHHNCQGVGHNLTNFLIHLRNNLHYSGAQTLSSSIVPASTTTGNSKNTVPKPNTLYHHSIVTFINILGELSTVSSCPSYSLSFGTDQDTIALFLRLLSSLAVYANYYTPTSPEVSSEQQSTGIFLLPSLSPLQLSMVSALTVVTKHLAFQRPYLIHYNGTPSSSNASASFSLPTSGIIFNQFVDLLYMVCQYRLLQSFGEIRLNNTSSVDYFACLHSSSSVVVSSSSASSIAFSSSSTSSSSSTVTSTVNGKYSLPLTSYKDTLALEDSLLQVCYQLLTKSSSNGTPTNTSFDDSFYPSAYITTIIIEHSTLVCQHILDCLRIMNSDDQSLSLSDISWVVAIQFTNKWFRLLRILLHHPNFEYRDITRTIITALDAYHHISATMLDLDGSIREQIRPIIDTFEKEFVLILRYFLNDKELDGISSYTSTAISSSSLSNDTVNRYKSILPAMLTCLSYTLRHQSTSTLAFRQFSLRFLVQVIIHIDTDTAIHYIPFLVARLGHIDDWSESLQGIENILFSQSMYSYGIGLAAIVEAEKVSSPTNFLRSSSSFTNLQLVTTTINLSGEAAIIFHTIKYIFDATAGDDGSSLTIDNESSTVTVSDQSSSIEIYQYSLSYDTSRSPLLVQVHLPATVQDREIRTKAYTNLGSSILQNIACRISLRLLGRYRTQSLFLDALYNYIAKYSVNKDAIINCISNRLVTISSRSIALIEDALTSSSVEAPMVDGYMPRNPPSNVALSSSSSSATLSSSSTGGVTVSPSVTKLIIDLLNYVPSPRLSRLYGILDAYLVPIGMLLTYDIAYAAVLLLPKAIEQMIPKKIPSLHSFSTGDITDSTSPTVDDNIQQLLRIATVGGTFTPTTAYPNPYTLINVILRYCTISSPSSGPVVDSGLIIEQKAELLLSVFRTCIDSGIDIIFQAVTSALNTTIASRPVPLPPARGSTTYQPVIPTLYSTVSRTFSIAMRSFLTIVNTLSNPLRLRVYSRIVCQLENVSDIAMLGLLQYWIFERAVLPPLYYYSPKKQTNVGTSTIEHYATQTTVKQLSNDQKLPSAPVVVVPLLRDCLKGNLTSLSTNHTLILALEEALEIMFSVNGENEIPRKYTRLLKGLKKIAQQQETGTGTGVNMVDHRNTDDNLHDNVCGVCQQNVHQQHCREQNVQNYIELHTILRALDPVNVFMETPIDPSFSSSDTSEPNVFGITGPVHRQAYEYVFFSLLETIDTFYSAAAENIEENTLRLSQLNLSRFLHHAASSGIELPLQIPSTSRSISTIHRILRPVFKYLLRNDDVETVQCITEEVLVAFIRYLHQIQRTRNWSAVASAILSSLTEYGITKASLDTFPIPLVRFDLRESAWDDQLFFSSTSSSSQPLANNSRKSFLNHSNAYRWYLPDHSPFFTLFHGIRGLLYSASFSAAENAQQRAIFQRLISILGQTAQVLDEFHGIQNQYFESSAWVRNSNASGFTSHLSPETSTQDLLPLNYFPFTVQNGYVREFVATPFPQKVPIIQLGGDKSTAIENQISYLLPENIALASHPFLVSYILSLLDLWCLATIRLQILPPEHPWYPHNEVVRIDIQIILQKLSANFGLSILGLVWSMAEVILPRIVLTLLHPHPTVLIDLPSDYSGDTLQHIYQGFKYGTDSSMLDQQVQPLFIAFIEDLCGNEIRPVAFLRASLPIIVPLLCTLDGGHTEQLEVLGWYLREHDYPNTAHSSSGTPSHIPTATSTTMVTEIFSRTTTSNGSTKPLPTVIVGNNSSVNASLSTTKGKRQRNILEFSTDKHTVEPVPNSSGNTILVSPPPSSFSSSSSFVNGTVLSSSITETTTFRNKTVSFFYAETSETKQGLVAKLLQEYAHRILARILLVPMRPKFAIMISMLLTEYIGNEASWMATTYFDSLFLELAWHLGEEAVDSPLNRASLALRQFAVLVQDGSRVDPSRLFRSGDIRRAAVTLTDAYLRSQSSTISALVGSSNAFAKLMPETIVSPGRSSKTTKTTTTTVPSTAGTKDALPPPRLSRANKSISIIASPPKMNETILSSSLLLPKSVFTNGNTDQELRPFWDMVRNLDLSQHIADNIFIVPLSVSFRYLHDLPLRIQAQGYDSLKEEVKLTVESARRLVSPLELVLQRYFLLLISKLAHLLNRPHENYRTKLHGLIVLQRILLRVSGDKLEKHVPAILALLKLALAQPPLRIAAACVWSTFVSLLSDSALRQHLSILVLGLLPFMERNTNAYDPAHVTKFGSRDEIGSKESSRPLYRYRPAPGHEGWMPEYIASAVEKYDQVVRTEFQNMAQIAHSEDHAYRIAVNDTFHVPIDRFGVPIQPLSGTIPVTATATVPVSDTATSSKRSKASTAPVVKETPVPPNPPSHPLGLEWDALPSSSSSLITSSTSSSSHPSYISSLLTSSLVQIRTCRDVVVRMLKYLLIEKRSVLRTSFPDIPSIGEYEGLDFFEDILIQERKQELNLVDNGIIRPEQRLPKLVILLRHDTDEVQQAALNEMLRFLSGTHTRKLHQLILDTSLDGAAPLIDDIVSALLELARRSTSVAIRQLCGVCLGQLGAIDPSRLSLVTKHKQTPELGDRLLVVELIRGYLVKALRAAPDTVVQDKFAYALQQLVRRYGEMLGVYQSSTTVPSETTTTVGNTTKGATKGNVPSVGNTKKESSSTAKKGNTNSSEVILLDDTYMDVIDGGNKYAGSNGTENGGGITVSYKLDPDFAGAVPLPAKIRQSLSTDLHTLMSVERSGNVSSNSTVTSLTDDTDSIARYEKEELLALLDVIAPYWSSKLKLTLAQIQMDMHVPLITQIMRRLTLNKTVNSSETNRSTNSSSLSILSKLDDPFEAWIALWTRYLIEELIKHGSPRSAVWEALSAVVQNHIPTALFILPYLIRDALALDIAPLTTVIIAEVLAVLRGDTNTNPNENENSKVNDPLSETIPYRDLHDILKVPSTGSHSLSSLYHRATHTIFAVNDTFERWILQIEERKPGEVAYGSIDWKLVLPNGGAHSLSTDNVSPDDNGPINKEPYFKISKFIVEMPLRTLADAAFRVHAYTRALLYLEQEQRSIHGGPYGSARITPNGLFDDSAIGGVVNGPVPYTRNDLAYMQLVYSHIDEPDGISGLAALRSQLLLGQQQESKISPTNTTTLTSLATVDHSRSVSLSSSSVRNGSLVSSPSPTVDDTLLSLRERIIDYEHEARWSDALMCYEQALQQMSDPPVWSMVNGTSTQSLEAMTKGKRILSKGTLTVTDMDNDEPSPNDPPSDLAVRSAALSESTLHAGLLRCLKNIDHMQTALNHAIGVVGRRPDLAPAVTPYAVEAAWRMGQWEPLEKLLAFGTSTNGSTSTEEKQPEDNSSTSVTIDINPDYDTALGTAMLQLHYAYDAATAPLLERARRRQIAEDEENEREEKQNQEHLPLSVSLNQALNIIHPDTYNLLSHFCKGLVFASSYGHVPGSQPVAAVNSSTVSSKLTDLRIPSAPIISTLLNIVPNFMNVGAEFRKVWLHPQRYDTLSSSSWTSSSIGLSVSSMFARLPVYPSSTLSSSSQGFEQRFFDALNAARKEVLNSLSAASMESYTRAYPFLIKLHVLRECEMAYTLVRQRDSSARAELLHQWEWPERLRMTMPSLALQEPLLALRRAIYRMFDLKDLEASSWLDLARAARAAGHPTTASFALLHASQLGSDVASLQTAKLLYSQGQVHRALMELEPIERNLSSVVHKLKTASITATAVVTQSSTKASVSSSTGSAKNGTAGTSQSQPSDQTEPTLLQDQAERARILEAKRILHATNWMVETRIAGEDVIINRYKAVAELHPHWEKAYFYLGKYYDTALKEMNDNVPSPEIAKRDKEGIISWRTRRDELLQKVAKYYSASLFYGHSHIFQSLPRVLTIFLDYGAALIAAKDSIKRFRSGYANNLVNMDDLDVLRNSPTPEICIRTGFVYPTDDTLRNTRKHMERLRDNELAGPRFYTGLNQLCSRICHRQSDCYNYISSGINMSLKRYPQQATWMFMGLAVSSVTLRRERAEACLQILRKYLSSGKSVPGTTQLVEIMTQLFEELNELARKTVDPKDKTCSIRIMERDRFTTAKVLVPLQSSLMVVLPSEKTDITGSNGSNGSNVTNRTNINWITEAGLPGDAPMIMKFDRTAEVMASKERPKKIAIYASDGRKYSFLCKSERRGDLRKDARTMEFATVINRILAKDPEGRRRKLRLRTYTVLILKEDTALLQWVNNTSGMRSEIERCYLLCQLRPLKDTVKEIRPKFEHIQTLQQEGKIHTTDAVREYRKEILPKFPPIFHRWFPWAFPDPTAWLEARTSFGRSASVWSIVGHVIGLGDRHGENLLLDRTTGECVHVDYDCIFDKGLALGRPEIVPFRLTPSMLDGLGLSGYEGVFRRVAEITMSTLRSHKGILLSVLEPFIYDPLVEWGRNKAQIVNADGDTSNAGNRGGSNVTGHDENSEIPATAAGGEKENVDAMRVLKRIAERLDGIYNAGTEQRKRAMMKGARGVPQTALEVRGQVHRLLKEATDDNNLAFMYVGWMPFL